MKLYSAIRFIMLIALFAANIFGVHNHLVKADVDYPVTRNLRAEPSSPPPPRRAAPVQNKPPYRSRRSPPPPSIRF